jgi:hypothetical protein
VSRGWVTVFLGAGLLVACSGSNEVEPFDGHDAADTPRDASPGTDATIDAVDAAMHPAPTPDAGAEAEAEASPDSSRDSSPDASLDSSADSSLDAGPEGADAQDGGGPAPEAGLDAAPDANAPDAAPCPVVSAVGDVYVDGAHGVDDDSHGGSPGACAYKTITFALTRAVRNIAVAAGTYSEAGGETLPLILTGRQGLVCTNAIISGQARYESSRATVVFDGTANGLSGCTVVGTDLPGACVFVESDGTKSGHVIESADVSHCADYGVRIGGTLVEIDDSSFHDSDTAISWSGSSMGDVSNNTFANNAFDDIECDDTPSDDISGSNNVDGTGDATCTGCSGCPFQ